MRRPHHTHSNRSARRAREGGRAPVDLLVLAAFVVGLAAGLAVVVRGDLTALVGVLLGLARFAQGLS